MSERMPVVFFGHGNPMNALLSKRLDARMGGDRRFAAEAESHSLRCPRTGTSPASG